MYKVNLKQSMGNKWKKGFHHWNSAQCQSDHQWIGMMLHLKKRRKTGYWLVNHLLAANTRRHLFKSWIEQKSMPNGSQCKTHTKKHLLGSQEAFQQLCSCGLDSFLCFYISATLLHSQMVNLCQSKYVTDCVRVALTPADLCLTISLASGSCEFSGHPGWLWHVMVSVKGHDFALYTLDIKYVQ